MASEQYVFRKDNEFFLIDVWENGQLTLKVKEHGWSDTWSLALERVGDVGQRLISK
jgi:hypothetical protein